MARTLPSGRAAIAGGILLLLLAALAWRNVTDLDFGIHMASGRWIVQNRAVPESDPFTFTVSDHAYVAYHWLFQVGAYAIHGAWGVPGVAAARWLLAIGTALLLADLLRVRRVSALAGASVGLAVILASETRLRLRPEICSYLLVAATLWVVERRRQGRRAPLWLLPLIQLTWVNTHVHAFGWLVLGAYLVDEALRARSLRTPLFAWSAVAFAALFANPYGIRAVGYPLYLATRMGKENVFSQQIVELTSPVTFLLEAGFRSVITSELVAWALLLAIALGAWLRALRRRRWSDVGVIAAFAGLSLLAERNVAIFSVATAPALAEAAHGGLARFARGAGPARRRLESACLALLLAFAALTTLRVVLGGFYQAQYRPDRFAAEVCRDCLAVGAADWLADHDVQGHGFNNFNMGATLLWRAPAHPVFIDGRNEVTGEAFFREYLRASDPRRWDETVRRFGLEYAVLAYRYDQALSGRLMNGSDWKLVYLDGSAAVFVRAEGPNGHLPEAVLPSLMSESQRARALREIRVDTSRRARLRQWLGLGDPPPGSEFHLGTWLLGLRRDGRSEYPLLRAARRSPSYPITHANLAALYRRGKLEGPLAVVLANLRAVDPDHPRLAPQRPRKPEGRAARQSRVKAGPA